MLNIKTLSEKELGIVLTPPKTAEYIISKLGTINKEDQKVLDPCVGPGIFVRKLLEKGVNKNQIFSFDINPEFKSEIEKLGINFKLQDTLLSMYPESYNEFDFIVGNPPYLNKASTYIRQNKLKLKKIYGKINAHETYAMFIVNSIWRLKNGGKLCFITSDSFLTLNTHTKLRKFILKNCKINEILLAPKSLFSVQDVNTNPVIIFLTKCADKEKEFERRENVIKIIPRLQKEDEYNNPKEVREIKQTYYHLLPFKLFFTELEPEVIDLFEKAPKLESYIKGYIGMHTHNNLKYIAAIEGTELSEIFAKRNKKISDQNKKNLIITKKEFESGKWKPYLKRGGSEQYYRPIIEALDWNENAILIYDIPNNVPFEEEGIAISGISSRLAARYMPKGCYWDSNKAIGFVIKDNSISIEYTLGLLNSSFYNYLAKGIINNTASIQLTGIHSIPFIAPDDVTKTEIEVLVKKIIENKKKNLDYDYTSEQKEIDNIVFRFYAKKFKLPDIIKVKLDQKYSNYAF